MNLKSKQWGAALLMAAAMGSAGKAGAVVYTWTGQAPANWDLSGANWNNGNAGQKWADDAGNIAELNGAGGMLTIVGGATRTAGGIHFGASGWTIAAGTASTSHLTTGGAGAMVLTLAANVSGTLAVGVPSSTTGGVIVTGAGTLTVGGGWTDSTANAFTGGITITGGATLATSSSNNFGNSANPIVLNGGAISAGASYSILSAHTIKLGSHDTTSGSGGFVVSNALTLQVRGSIVDNATGGGAGDTLTFASVGAPGTLELSGANTYSGGTIVSGGGTLLFHPGSLGSGKVTLGNGATLQWAAGATTDISGQLQALAPGVAGTLDLLTNNVTLAGADALQGPSTSQWNKAANPGTLTLANSNSFAGTYLADDTGGGTVLKHADALHLATVNLQATTTTGGIRFDAGVGGGFTLGNLTGSGNLSLQDSGANAVTLALGNNSGNATYSGAISGNGGIKKIGNGTLTLTKASSYTGGTVIEAGELIVSNVTGSATGSGAVTLSAGMLGGSGAIAGAVVAGTASHVLAPGATGGDIATLAIGALTTNPFTTIQVDLAANGTTRSSDLLRITTTGGLTLSGGAITIGASPTGPGSIGYYKIMQYTGTIGGAGIGSLSVPATANGVAYFLTTSRDPGFIDLHRGFVGDTNDDGTVDLTDLTTLAGHWQQTGGWTDGDFDGSGTVDLTDLTLLAGNWQSGMGSFGAAVDALGFGSLQPTIVPEPGGLACMVLGAGALLKRRRQIAG